MSKRKVLTRAESQAQTREDLLDAGERLLLEGGYHSTSLATIAAEAGRTIGAVYSNYASKEELCLEILSRRISAEIAGLLGDLVESEDDLDSRLEAVRRRWARLADDSRLLLLAAEYVMMATRQPDQLDRTMETIRRSRDALRELVVDHLPDDAGAVSATALDRAVQGVMAAGLGLAAMASLDQIGAEESAELLVDVIRMWLAELVASIT